MGGKRQHYLPQFLQARVRRRERSGANLVLSARAIPKEVGIRDVGVEDYFYSDSSDTTLDTSITALENGEFGSAIQQIRDGQPGPISALDVPKLFAHLEVRSRHLRAGFTDSCEMLWDVTVELLKQPELLAGLFQSRYRRDPTSIVREAENQLRARNLPTEFAEQIAQTAAASLATPSSNLFAPFWGFVLPMAEKIFKPKLREAVKTAHQDAKPHRLMAAAISCVDKSRKSGAGKQHAESLSPVDVKIWLGAVRDVFRGLWGNVLVRQKELHSQSSV